MSVAYVAFQIFSGQIPVTSASFTPGGAGHQIFLVPNSNGGNALAFSMTGTATTPSAVAVSSAYNFGDGVGNSYALWDNLACASGAQTFTVSAPTSDYTGPVPILEFSGASSVKSALYTITTNPGVTAGAITGQAVTVATGDLLVTAVYDGSAPFGTVCTVATGGSTNITTYASSRFTYWSGAGALITPTFTAAAGQTSDTYIVIQWIVSASGTSLALTAAGVSGSAGVLQTSTPGALTMPGFSGSAGVTFASASTPNLGTGSGSRGKVNLFSSVAGSITLSGVSGSLGIADPTTAQGVLLLAGTSGSEGVSLLLGESFFQGMGVSGSLGHAFFNSVTGAVNLTGYSGSFGAMGLFTNANAPIPAPPTWSAWTADSVNVTADTINFTCDGADLINNGGTPIIESTPGKSSNKLAYSVSVPLFVQYKGGS